MFYLLKYLLLPNLVILKQNCNNIFYFNLVFICFVCVFAHSHLVKNHPIWIQEDGPLISEVVLSQASSLSHFRLANWQSDIHDS
jgi:hypothetical protein